MPNVLKKLHVEPNDRCPCGSGQQFKHCCINSSEPPEVIDWIRKQYEKFESQGNIKQNITCETKERRFIGIGDGDCYIAPIDQTFHEFLINYSKHILGNDWCNSELLKLKKVQHPLIQWLTSFKDLSKMPSLSISGKRSYTCSGPVKAFLHLAYYLYVLRHHVLLQKRLINRLKNVDQFQGAYYELYVTAMFIRAGFDIDFEVETDGSTSHCEFTAKFQDNGHCFSVEVKSRGVNGLLGKNGSKPDQPRLRIGRLLHKALKKNAPNDRIIFLDINMPPEDSNPFETSWSKELFATIENEERKLINGKPAPPAYLFITNIPHHWVTSLEEAPAQQIISTGFNIADFKQNHLDEQKHLAYIKLSEAIIGFRNIPQDF